ncbi:uncharacterized protein LOC144446681 [Glandiceps talaboti]
MENVRSSIDVVDKDTIHTVVRETIDKTKELIQNIKEQVEKSSLDLFVSSASQYIGPIIGVYASTFTRLNCASSDEFHDLFKSHFKNVDIQELYDELVESESEWDELLQTIDGRLKDQVASELDIGSPVPLDVTLIDVKTSQCGLCMEAWNIYRCGLCMEAWNSNICGLCMEAWNIYRCGWCMEAWNIYRCGLCMEAWNIYRCGLCMEAWNIYRCGLCMEAWNIYRCGLCMEAWNIYRCGWYHVAQIVQRQDEVVSAGGRVLLVSFFSQQAGVKWLEEMQCPFDMLLDPDKQLYKEIGLGYSLCKVWEMQVMHYYVTQIASKRALPKRLSEKSEDIHQMGGDFIINTDGKMEFIYYSRKSTDRPTVDQLIDSLKGVSKM